MFVSTGGLDLSNGTWIELELIGPASGQFSARYNDKQFKTLEGGDVSTFVDDWDAGVYCYGGICLDLNWDMFVTEADFLIVVSGAGSDRRILSGWRFQHRRLRRHIRYRILGLDAEPRRT